MSTNGHAVLGIDVGLDGALAFYRVGWCATCRPLTTGSCIAGEAICALLREQAPIKHAYIDHATAMPRQGVASMSSFGRTFGALQMALVAANISDTSSHRERRSKGCGARPVTPCSGAHELMLHRPMAGQRCAAILIGLAQ
jgi:hypothetical protein